MKRKTTKLLSTRYSPLRAMASVSWLLFLGRSRTLSFTRCLLSEETSQAVCERGGAQDPRVPRVPRGGHSKFGPETRGRFSVTDNGRTAYFVGRRSL